MVIKFYEVSKIFSSKQTYPTDCERKKKKEKKIGVKKKRFNQKKILNKIYGKEFFDDKQILVFF